MSRKLLTLAALLFLGGVLASAQDFTPAGDAPRADVMPDFSVQRPLPVLAPEIALQTFLNRTTEQSKTLAAYRDETTVTAELPDTQQKGEYQLERSYTAQPRTLSFSNAHFTGDGFVKTNVITRLLQSEVDHVEKGNSADTAVDFKNYKFYYKGVGVIDGHEMHEFQVKPRRKVPGLFKGRIYIDVHSASLRRMEGTLTKTPSFFIKNLEFVQDFQDVEGYTFPTYLHSSAKARIIGRALVNVIHRSYRVNAAATESSTTAQSMP